MSKRSYNINSLEELQDTAEEILNVCQGRHVFIVDGEMGAGKTTLIKELCSALGSRDNFSSPTYSIVNEYRIKGTKEPIYHMDLYRLENIEEALNAGIAEYLTGENYCFIEWPLLVMPLLPPGFVKIAIKTDGNTRNVSIFMD